MACQFCGSHAPTKYVAFYSNIGFFLARREREVKGELCKQCINKHFWEFTLVNLLLGWWGIASFFFTIFFLINNTVRYIGARRLPAVARARQPADYRPPWAITRTLVFLVLALAVGCVVMAAVMRKPGKSLSPIEVQATAQALAAVTAPAQIQTRTAALAQAAKSVYGPASDTLTGHKDEMLELSSPVLKQRNFIAEVRFYNPAITSESGWSYGFVFRSTRDTDYRLYVTSEGYWFFSLVTGPGFNPKFNDLADGKVAGLDVSRTGSNQLRLVVSNTEAFFFANGKYVGTLDVSGNSDSGGIRAGIEFEIDDEREGTTTRYEDFTVWELP
ncbi:MAG TPA: hypothetical protein VJ183_13405 [Chloroflexia bacterium]|nr:hypothetical protein [Chloroflexia bacterium]